MNKFTTFTCIVFMSVCFMSHSVGAQESDPDKSSRRENAAIQAIEKAGGKVHKISAADESREISCYLASEPIKDEHLKHAGAIKNVIWMNLAGTAITDDGLKFISTMPLEKLHLERTNIGDKGLEHLKKMNKLTYLNLYGSKVTDEGLQHLKGLTELKKLYVWKTGVTENGMKKLNESLPELQIIGEVKLEPVVLEEPKEKATEEKKATEKKADKKSPANKDADQKTNKNKGSKKKNQPPKKEEDKS